ncbi:FHA domain-containing protein [Acetonema longum]|uniref:FHA domain-containing protein n=1 Tax=Acetonema longum DSM 6540 TaxID=1009370 RepID=F7NKH7_9FIRM|nr:FHA domain-containing protein [Acetonema longum]EGO63429.1 hypothetical protein ALO_12955 [Acetonema longum DSM 6540]
MINYIRIWRLFLLTLLLTSWIIKGPALAAPDPLAAAIDSPVRLTAEQVYVAAARVIRQERMFRLLIGLIAIGVVLSVIMWRRNRAGFKRELAKSQDVLRPALLYDVQKVSGQSVFTLSKPLVSIGQAVEEGRNGVDIPLPITNLAAVQAVLEYRTGAFYLVNYNEGVALTVNGLPVLDEARLKSGDQICIASRPFRFLVPGDKEYTDQRRQCGLGDC